MGKVFLIFAVVLIAVPVLALLSGTILYFLWPVVMVEVFKFPPLTWWQAVCLSYIAAILLKSYSYNSKD